MAVFTIADTIERQAHAYAEAVEWAICAHRFPQHAAFFRERSKQFRQIARDWQKWEMTARQVPDGDD